MAAGAWSASILTDAADEWNLPVIPPVKPRKVTTSAIVVAVVL